MPVCQVSRGGWVPRIGRRRTLIRQDIYLITVRKMGRICLSRSNLVGLTSCRAHLKSWSEPSFIMVSKESSAVTPCPLNLAAE